jgi:hypothetical protein
MEEIIKAIDKQIELNKGMNIFSNHTDGKMPFINETIESILRLKDIDDAEAHKLINYTTEKAIEEFCRINQYYSFDNLAKAELRSLYRNLFLSFKANNPNPEQIAQVHFENLKAWLLKYNGFAERMYADEAEQIDPVACSEYSYELQENILQLNFNDFDGKILDIGCGQRAILVNALKEKDLDVFGFDRLVTNTDHTAKTDWLDFDYGISKWDCIISHLGFANHFRHHNLREDGDYINYGKCFMRILASLKPGGKFHYVPDLPFIEQYLNPKEYSIEKHEVEGFDFEVSVIERLI